MVGLPRNIVGARRPSYQEFTCETSLDSACIIAKVLLGVLKPLLERKPSLPFRNYIAKFANPSFVKSVSLKEFGEMLQLLQNIACAYGIDNTFEMNSSFNMACGYQYDLVLPGTKIPKWFNHQTVGSSLSFSADLKFPGLVFCVALNVELKHIVPNRLDMFDCYINVFVNGFEQLLTSHYINLDSSSSFLWFCYMSDSSLEAIISDDWHDVKLQCEISNYDPKLATVSIERCGIYVEYICHPQNSSADKSVNLRCQEGNGTAIRNGVSLGDKMGNAIGKRRET